MPKFLVKGRGVEEKEVKLPWEAVVSLGEAAEMLGITKSGVASALDRGAFATVLYPASGGRRQYRSLLRIEVEAEVRRRAAKAPLTGDDFLY